MAAAKRATYWDYIRVEDLLSLQGGLAGDESALSNDEVRFITIHQVDELWFKLVLRELATTRDLFRLSYVPETSLASANAALRRVSLIFRLAAQHFQLMETMRTQDYLAFRDKLSPASGFQSAQFREIEILLGLGDDERIPLGCDGSYLAAVTAPDGGSSPALERIQRRQQDQPTLKEAVYAWLHRTPIDGSVPRDPGDREVVDRFLLEFASRHERSIREIMRTALAAQATSPADAERLRARYEAEIAATRCYLLAEDTVEGEARDHVRRLRAAILFIDTNRQLPLLSWPGEIVDSLIELEQSMLVFRQRHARMVERVIGRRVGTGGSDGVDYLDRTAIAYRLFKEIWAARTMLLHPEAAPPAANPSFYGLRMS
jgi:tryptophan 2,3-dioxygenase